MVNSLPFLFEIHLMVILIFLVMTPQLRDTPYGRWRVCCIFKRAMRSGILSLALAADTTGETCWWASPSAGDSIGDSLFLQVGVEPSFVCFFA